MLVDLEYAMPNFRGFDIASYYNDSYIDYIWGRKPTPFVILEEYKMSFEPNEEVEKMVIIYLSRYFNKHLNRNDSNQ